MSYKTVNKPIKVPEGNYCWNRAEQGTVCPFLNHRYTTCELGMGTVPLKENNTGTLKPDECLKLQDA